MGLEFGLLMTLIGVVSVFSSLAVVALVCVVLKRLFKSGTAEEVEVPPPKELELKGVEEAGIGTFRICLLYTSPSPRDQRGSRMPSSA